ncbi:1-(5-phosphoribosyl)-5-[(5-phosphoribosylamino)methylideneamino]imidazole-4-carboxamide isomerase [Oscillospiraceae bacterium HV4-5-C5C]|nr:1-(5-phosphoribosyl)-5-[(5-phosphoribosylamino)methylideneamino]imidazole-4-carboxamide isomerase [Oscillospiraceae bacterium HV4-5-C5C]
MQLYPAIDLLDRSVVRLREGDYEQVREYTDEVLFVAQSFQRQGADWLHLVDLNAARGAAAVNRDLIAAICRLPGLKVQTGGGIRSLATIEALLAAGVSRCVIGTAAVRDPDMTAEALRRWPEQIAIAVDSRDGRIRVQGWTEDSGINLPDFALRMKHAGAKTLIFTDISRDGLLKGPAVEETRKLKELTGLEVILSAGISSVEDIAAARDAGLDGAILGRALYEGKVDLADALRLARQLPQPAATRPVKNELPADEPAADESAVTAWNTLAGQSQQIWQALKKDAAGLVCAITVDAATGAVLMQAYQDQAALTRTLETGLLHYHSRSRNCLWLKGETSGHYQHVQAIEVDCDADCLLYRVKADGPACHTGATSCFFRRLEEFAQTAEQT